MVVIADGDIVGLFGRFWKNGNWSLNPSWSAGYPLWYDDEILRKIECEYGSEKELTGLI